MRLMLRVLLLVTLALPAIVVADEVDDAVARADELLAESRFAEAVAVLEPFESLGRPDVDERLAGSLMDQTLSGANAADMLGMDLSRMMALAERAGAKGSGAALNRLYMLHANGWTVPVDPGKALDYLKRAVEAGDDGAKLNYAVNLYQGSHVVERDVDAACDLLRDLMDRDNPNVVAAYYVGLTRFRGQCGKAANAGAGARLVEIAAGKGVREAERDMGRILEHGWAGETDLGKALTWYQRAADNGESAAQWRIGMAYVRGEGRKPDPVEAVRWFERSAAGGDADGLTSLAVMHASGDGVPQDFAKAMSLYRQAAEAGSTHAYRGLAMMYLRGEGVEADPARAWVLYSQAVASGNEEEPALLAEIEARLGKLERRAAEREFEDWRKQRTE
jgi:TPR repeat protein